MRGGHSFVDQATITGESKPPRSARSVTPEPSTNREHSKSSGVWRETSFGKIVVRWKKRNARVPVRKRGDRTQAIWYLRWSAAVTFAVTRVPVRPFQ